MPDTDVITPGADTQTGTDEQASKAYEFVAHAAALAVQDAVDNLRNINSICAAALGAVFAQTVENPGAIEQANAITKMIQDVSAEASANFLVITDNISRALHNFPNRN